mmetsp:Transcript_360/g.1061  ORF Transcript_360/g.1061 Transcript_360/m.1061 type:complete len:93 (+) Transcript_360:36-314(+)
MSVFSVMFGAGWGFGVACWANGMRKLPLLRRPWEHLGIMVVGGYVGYKYPIWEEQLRVDIDKIRAQRGMPPLNAKPWLYNYAQDAPKPESHP